jgi:hypothetical protein
MFGADDGRHKLRGGAKPTAPAAEAILTNEDDNFVKHEAGVVTTPAIAIRAQARQAG